MSDGTPTGRDLDAVRERFLREKLSELQRTFQAQAEPYVKELTDIQNRKPIIFHMDLSQCETRILAQMNRDVTPPPKEHDDPCPECGEPLEDGPGGGVKCPNKECGYWFCF